MFISWAQSHCPILVEQSGLECNRNKGNLYTPLASPADKRGHVDMARQMKSDTVQNIPRASLSTSQNTQRDGTRSHARMKLDENFFLVPDLEWFLIIHCFHLSAPSVSTLSVQVSYVFAKMQFVCWIENCLITRFQILFMDISFTTQRGIVRIKLSPLISII